MGCSQKAAPAVQETVEGKPDALINLCGGEKRWNVSKATVLSFQEAWILCEVDCDYLGAEGVPYKEIAILNYPNMDSLTSGSEINLWGKAVRIGRYQIGDQFYEAYDCGALATNAPAK